MRKYLNWVQRFGTRDRIRKYPEGAACPEGRKVRLNKPEEIALRGMRNEQKARIPKKRTTTAQEITGTPPPLDRRTIEGSWARRREKKSRRNTRLHQRMTRHQNARKKEYENNPSRNLKDWREIGIRHIVSSSSGSFCVAGVAAEVAAPAKSNRLANHFLVDCSHTHTHIVLLRLGLRARIAPFPPLWSSQ